MESERNKKIAISVLQGMTYDNVGIKYNISRERVYKITKIVLKRIDLEIDKDHNINELRKVCNQLINKISKIDC
jgi:DNA-directed RNA polymerase sigma subunit (sigma70/sigma32)